MQMMNPINLVAIAASLNLILQLYMAVWGNFALAILSCDFAEDKSKFRIGGTLYCRETFQEDDIIEVSCPRDVGGVNYSIYPENPTEYAYVYSFKYYESRHATYGLKVWPLKQIFGTMSGRPIVEWKDDEARDTLVIKYPTDKLLLRRLDSNLLYICRPYGIDIESPRIMRALRSILSDRYPYSDNVIHSVDGRGTESAHLQPMAIFNLDLRFVSLVTHGCGYPHGNLFLNMSRYDPNQAHETCSVDIMKTPNVGFYCDGSVEPPDCFNKLIGYHDPEIPNLAFGGVRTPLNGLYYMNYDRARYPKAFSGSCYCKEKNTNEIKASITVTRGVTQTCNLRALLFKNRVQPFLDDWCDVILHPVDTLTIIYPPITGIYDHLRDEYTNFEGVEHHCVATLVPMEPQVYLMRRLFWPGGEELMHTELSLMHPHNGLIVRHDRRNRRIAVRVAETGWMDLPVVFNYIWQYKCPKWMGANINAFVRVTAVFDPDARSWPGGMIS